MNLEHFNFVKDGAIKLPPGFRFQPTDEELVFQYLLRKTFSCPLPASIIPVLNVCNLDPWDLPGDDEQERYFFSNKELKYKNGNRNNRATQTGYWKPTGIDKQIINNASQKKKPIIGKRKTLVFYQGKPPHGTRTHWIMHEYRLILSRNDGIFSPNQISAIQIGHWVICHIFMNKRRSKSSGFEMVDEKWRRDCKFATGNERGVDQYIIEEDSMSSCGGGSVASDLSVLTEVSSNCN